MQCELQFEYSADALVVGDCGESLTVKEFINELLKQYHGSIVREHYNKGTTIVLEFPELINAQCFFHEFKQKMTPRMFTQDEKGKAHFDDFDDDKLKEAANSDFNEECYQAYSLE